jgi:hypothetical protein
MDRPPNLRRRATRPEAIDGGGGSSERRVERNPLHDAPSASAFRGYGALRSSETEAGCTGRRRLVSSQRLTLRGDESRHEVNAGGAGHLKGMDLAALDP